MEADFAIPVGLCLTCIVIMSGIIVSHVKSQVKADRTLALAELNDTRHANPEDSGIGTRTTNVLIKSFHDVIKEFQASNRIMNMEMREVVRGNSENYLRNSIALENLTKAIEKMG